MGNASQSNTNKPWRSLTHHGIRLLRLPPCRWLLTAALVNSPGCVSQNHDKKNVPASPQRNKNPGIEAPQSQHAERINPEESTTPSTPDVMQSVPQNLPLGRTFVIQSFQRTHSYYVSDQDNKRTLSRYVSFPRDLAIYQSITLRLRLECPESDCDRWDRWGSLSIRQENGQAIELARFVTPYGVATDLSFDISHLSPLLVGDKAVEAFIDTWVGPGHNQGAGWLVTLDFEFAGGQPQAYPVAVLPVFSLQEIEVGDPSKSSQRIFEGKIPDLEFSQTKLFAYVTGHGQGNTENCAEFCPKTHSFLVDQTRHQARVWRDDCRQTHTPQPQAGNSVSSRAGWCPGASVRPIVFDTAVNRGPIRISYEPEAYINQTRSGYNGGSHTKPYYQISSVLVFYRTK